MAQSIALNEWEQKKLYKKMIELNNKLSEKEMRGISKESQLVHKILELAIDKLDISESGTIILKWLNINQKLTLNANQYQQV